MNKEENIRKKNLEGFWSLAEMWFRVLEYSLLIGLFYYLAEETGNLIVKGIYIISHFLLLFIFLELGELLSVKLYKKRIRNKTMAFIISMSLTLFLFIMIVETVKLLRN